MKKIGIVGARGFTTQTEDYRVVSIPWDQMAKLPNLSDFDALLLNLIPLEENTAHRSKIDWGALFSKLHKRSVMDILGNEGQIIVLGDPRFAIQWRARDGQNHDLPFLHWSGMNFEWEEQSGSSNNDTFQDYLDRARFNPYLLTGISKPWTYFLTDCEVNGDVASGGLDLDNLTEQGIDVRLHQSVFRRNRYGGSLAFEVHFVLTQVRCGGLLNEPYVETLNECGPMVLLPRTTLDDETSVSMILRDVFGVEIVLSEPEWVAQLRAPGQEPIDEDLNKLQGQIESLIGNYHQLEEVRNQKRQILRLLYDRGTNLEHIVRETLRELGADVEEPDDPGQEDGWVAINIGGQVLEGVLEVKGTAKENFTEDGLNQLHKWKHRGIQLRQKKYKGIFIGNVADETAPDQRPSDPFSHNFKNHAELQEAVAILTTDLYKVYQLKQIGFLDEGAFWTDVFNTSGVFDISPYSDLLDKHLNSAPARSSSS